MTGKLNILTAGVAKSMVMKAAALWDEKHPELPVSITPGGSVKLIRELKNGMPCDILVSADDAIIESMMVPEYADGYTCFAGNKMVIMALHGQKIPDKSWKELLLDPSVTFGYSNPAIDPGGYRAEMSLLLADNLEQGLSTRLLQHPGRKTLQKPDDDSVDYRIYYYTRALEEKADMLELPKEMDLSDPALNDVYGKVEVELGDGTVKGSAIRHALTIPKTAQHPVQAQEFIQLFLAQDFAAEGFLPCK